MSDWINIGESWPDQGQEVWYFFEFTGVQLGTFNKYFDDDFEVELPQFIHWSGNSWLTGDVTHWMPVEANVLGAPVTPLTFHLVLSGLLRSGEASNLIREKIGFDLKRDFTQEEVDKAFSIVVDEARKNCGVERPVLN